MLNIYKWIKYYYQKKNNYLEAYIKDLITQQNNNNLKAYKIDLITTEKLDKSINEFNHFIYKYNGVTYELKNGITKTIY